MRLPDLGLPPDDVRDRLRAAAGDDVDWRHARTWSLVYDSPDWHSTLVREAAAAFADENALSHSAFPSAARFESSVIGMVASVLSPDRRAHGVFTSGGTESILQAVKAYRDARGVPNAEIVVPTTAHPAFGKAAHYLGMRAVQVPVGASGQVDPDDVAAALGPRTVMVAASAPNFPYGVVDPVPELAAVAAERGVGVHVDSAVGGLFLPFLEAAGRTPPRFALDVPGVTSVSVDLHKYGWGAKGASVLLFATSALRRASYYVSTAWPGGAYAAPGVLGTRPVGPAAAAYAAMVSLGRSGYRELVAQVMTTASRLQEGIAAAGPFRLVAPPAMSVFAVTSGELDLATVVGGLQRRGWRIDTQPAPPSMHFVVFPRHAEVVDAFIADVRAAAGEAAAAGRRSSSAAGAGEGEGLSSYGVMVRGAVDEEALADHLDARFDGEDAW